MTASSAQAELIGNILRSADVEIGGKRAGDIHVHDPRFYSKVLSKWSLGLGESYMDGDWDCDDLDVFCRKILSQDLNDAVRGIAKLRLAGEVLRSRLINLQTKVRALKVGQVHYDLGNDLYEAMLDSRMIYSCGYWENAQTLEDAQTDKLEMICQKLELKRGERLLDIGCGWGGLLLYAAEHYGVEGVGITISKEQHALASARCRSWPIRIRLQDYRDLSESFDKIVSVGMFEHVGLKNYRTYFDAVDRNLKDSGLFLLHTIGSAETIRRTDPWIDKYIFPHGKIPSPREIMEAIEGLFVLEDWHNFGTDYDKTLMAWYGRFERAWPRLKAHYDTRFYRMWRYYLLMSAGNFRSRQGQLWQLVFSKREREIPYRSIRMKTTS